MFTFILFVMISAILIGLCVISFKPFAKKGWLCLLGSYVFLLYSSFKFGFHWLLILIYGILFLIGLVLWISIEKEERENIESAQSISGGINNFFQNLAGKASGDSSFLGSIFGSLANEASGRVNNMLGVNDVPASDKADTGHLFNVLYLVATIICIIVLAIIYKVQN